LFPEPEVPFRIDAAEIVFVVPSSSLGRVSDFTGGDRAKDLMARGEADMIAELKKRHLLDSAGLATG
jgi:hypothetical protein